MSCDRGTPTRAARWLCRVTVAVPSPRSSYSQPVGQLNTNHQQSKYIVTRAWLCLTLQVFLIP